jgi:hypothetical protein
VRRHLALAVPEPRGVRRLTRWLGAAVAPLGSTSMTVAFHNVSAVLLDEALTANLIRCNRRCKAHSGTRVTDP